MHAHVELSDIHDAYTLDVDQFVAFMKERGLRLVEGLKAYADWLDHEHDGKHYSAATINRKIAAAKSRIRYAFKHSSSARSLHKKYQLEEVLKTVSAKRIDDIAIPADKLLSIREVTGMMRNTKDVTIRLMVKFLVGTGVRIFEMLGVRLADIERGKRDFMTIRVLGKGRRERTIHVKKRVIDRIRRRFGGSTYLFEHDGKQYNRISVTNRIKHEFLKTIGKEATAQQLRHTWAVTQIRKGKSISSVAAALGHADPGLTAKMYANEQSEPQDEPGRILKE